MKPLADVTSHQVQELQHILFNESQLILQDCHFFWYVCYFLPHRSQALCEEREGVGVAAAGRTLVRLVIVVINLCCTQTAAECKNQDGDLLHHCGFEAPSSSFPFYSSSNRVTNKKIRFQGKNPKLCKSGSKRSDVKYDIGLTNLFKQGISQFFELYPIKRQTAV